MDTPLDFSAFVMNRLKVDTLTPELLVGPTFEPIKGSCKSLVELEYFFKEVYKATTDQLDQNNPEGQQYPHDLRKPLPLIPNSRGRQVIPFDYFINNDLAYLSGGVSIQKYTTLVTKTKAIDYRSIVIQRRVEDLQLGVKSYQKKLNLTKLDTYKSDLKRREAYIAYPIPEEISGRLDREESDNFILLCVYYKWTHDRKLDITTQIKRMYCNWGYLKSEGGVLIFDRKSVCGLEKWVWVGLLKGLSGELFRLKGVNTWSARVRVGQRAVECAEGQSSVRRIDRRGVREGIDDK
ncbi:hypothetical protein Tco_0127058 [Tanacetum coccineum]